MHVSEIKQAISRFIVTGLIISTLGGCSSPPKITLDDPEPEQGNVSLVYGYFDMDKAQSASYHWLVARRYRPSTREYEMHVYQSGLFYHLGVENGSHQVVRLGAYETSFHFGTHRKNETAIKINKPGLYYMGSFEYDIKRSDSWLANGGGSFSAIKTKKPSEKEVLTLLLKVMKDEYSDYTTQIGWIEKRIKEL